MGFGIPCFRQFFGIKALMEKPLVFFLKAIPVLRVKLKRGNSRFDFKLEFLSKSVYMEVKSVSLVKDGVGKFPDAPTKRGLKHVKELIDFCGKGYRTAILFVSQRQDTISITCNDEIDPEFSQWLRRAEKEGVELYGMNCDVNPHYYFFKPSSEGDSLKFNAYNA
ncbi:MAG: hypothetical protein Ct9H300mP23_02280 [Nitrospinota bacterium]|nr:MAG: hypothetical protein Ct9H300mP23_02280 [Nitrospinota bacterium]